VTSALLALAPARPLRFTLPGLPPRPNDTQGRHWSKGKRRKWRRDAALAAFGAPSLVERPELSVVVTLTRCRTRGPEMDGDGLQGSLKAVRDGIADVLYRHCERHVMTPGCGHEHDGEGAIEWRYEQRTARRSHVEVCVAVGGER
jgi:hypothetical protein